MNVQTLERCFNESIDREVVNIVDKVDDRIQNAISTAIDTITTQGLNNQPLGQKMRPLDETLPVSQ